MPNPPPLDLKIGDSAIVVVRPNAQSAKLLRAEVIDAVAGKITVLAYHEPPLCHTYRVSVLEFCAETGKLVSGDGGRLFLTTSARQRWYIERRNEDEWRARERRRRERVA